MLWMILTGGGSAVRKRVEGSLGGHSEKRFCEVRVDFHGISIGV
jgi:hypothetical protein